MARSRPRRGGGGGSGGQAPRGLQRGMRSLQGFASQANAAYGRLNETLLKLIPTVSSLAQQYATMRDTLKNTVPIIDSANSSFSRMRTTIGSTIPLVAALSAQLGQMAITAKGSSLVAANSMSSFAAAAVKANGAMAASSTGLLAALGPFALLAAAAGAVYVALFKWDEIPLILKPILLIISPLVLAVRALATAWSVATAPYRAFTGAVSLGQAAIRGLLSTLISLPGSLASVTTSAVKFAWSLSSAVASGAAKAASALRSLTVSALGSIGKLGGLLQGLGQSILSVTNSLTAPLTRAGEQFITAGVAVAALAAASGLAVRDVQALGYAAEQSGSSVEAMADAAGRMQQRLLEAQAGSDTAAAAFTQLGLSVDDLLRMSPEDRFAAVGTAIAELADPLERAKAAQDAFGTSAETLIGMFAKGQAGLAEMRAEAERLGLVLSEDQVASAKEAAAAQKMLRDSLTGLWRTLGAAIAPQLAETARQMASVVTATINWVRRNQETIAAAFRMAATIASVGTALTTVASGLALATPGLVALSAALAAGWVAWGRYGDNAKSALGSTLQVLQQIYDETMRVLGGIWQAIQGGDLELAVDIAWLGVQTAWTSGLMAIAEMTHPVFAGMLNALAAGDWSSAADQAWSAVQAVFELGLSSLDSLWTGLETTIDSVITYMRQQINVAIGYFADLAMQALKKVDSVAMVLQRYDPTGKVADLRLAMGNAARASGLTAAANASPEARNAALAAEQGQRQAAREAAFGDRQLARNARLTGLRDQLQAGQAQAGDSAQLTQGTRLADLEAKLFAAQQAAAAAETERQAQDLERRKRLEKGATAGGSEGFGAVFSGAALLAMAGGGGPQERAAKAGENVARNTAELVAIAKDAKERNAGKNQLVWQP